MKIKPITKNKKCFSLLTLFLIITTFFYTIIVFADDTQSTLVYVNPTNQIVAPGQNFNISINCAPGQPIKSFEFKLSFNASLLEADSVSQGDIFNGYETFFSNGTINNSAGTIINIYGLILGQGNVTTNGTLANISFKAKSVSGVSYLNIYELGLTNETNYVPTIINNGTAQVDGIAPEIIDNSPSNGYTGDNYTFSVSVTDNVYDASNLSVYVNWTHGGNNGNNTMTHMGGNVFQKTVILDLNSVANLTYKFYAIDYLGNVNSTNVLSKTVIDNDLPVLGVISANPGIQEIGGSVNITAQITDNIGIDKVFLNISYPEGSYENISIKNNKSNNVYYCNKTFSQYGTHYYFIWVDDLYGNSVASSTYSFLIGDFSAPIISDVLLTSSNPLDTDPQFGWVNITCKVEDNVAVAFVYLNITNPNESINKLTMASYSLDYYYSNSSGAFSQHGNYSYKIESIDNDLNTVCSDIYIFSLPPNYDVNMDGVQNLLDLVLISEVYGQTGNPGWIREDVDNNGIIQIFDMVLVSNHYNQSWW